MIIDPIPVPDVIESDVDEPRAALARRWADAWAQQNPNGVINPMAASDPEDWGVETLPMPLE